MKTFSMIATINRGLLNKKMSLSIIMLLRQNFINTFIKIAILGKIYQCSNCYAKLEQHWIECICVHSSPITRLFDHKIVRTLYLSVFSPKFPISVKLLFRRNNRNRRKNLVCNSSSVASKSADITTR